LAWAVALTCRILALVVPLLILVFYAGYYEFRWQYTQYTVTVVTRHVTDRDDVTAKCVRRLDLNFMNLPVGGVAGMAHETNSEVSYSFCRDLAAWLMTDRQRLTVGAGMALHVIIHEAVHLTGETDESTTECKTVLMYEDVAYETLGIDRETSRRFIEYYKKQKDNDPAQLALGYSVDWNRCKAEDAKSDTAPDDLIV
jgi:hypothetical protein